MLAYIKIRGFFGQHFKLKTVPFLPMRRPLSLYTGPRCAINAPFINKILWLYICMTYWTLGFSKESKRCTRLPPYQLSLELCLVSLWIKLNEGRIHFLRHNVCCWNLEVVLYRTYIIIKSTSSRKCKDDCVSEEQIRTILKIFEGL